MPRRKNSPLGIVLAAGILLLTAFLIFAAYRNSSLSQPGPPDLSKLPPPVPPPEWNGAYPAVVIRMDAAGNAPMFTAKIESHVPTLRRLTPVNQFEVDLHLGRFILRQTDLFAEDSIPLALTRTYAAWDSAVHAFGAGSNHPYDICPTGTRNPYTELDLNLEDGRTIHYPRISPGTSYTDAVYRHEETSSEFYNSRIAWNGNGWTLKFADGSEVIFPEAYSARNFAQGAPTEIANAAGRKVTLHRGGNRNLTTLTSPSGRTITFDYDDHSRIVKAKSGDTVRLYAYDPSGHLQSVSDGSRSLYEFRYAPLLHERNYDSYLLIAVADGKGRELVRNRYTDGGRVSEQRLADGQTIRYRYNFDSRQAVAEASVTLPDGTTTSVTF